MNQTHNTFDTATAELGTVRLTLRSDLAFLQRRLGGRRCYVLEDVSTGHFYRLGLPEYTLVSLLDGSRTLNEAVAQSARVLGRDAISLDEAAALGRWLIDNQLAQTAASTSQQRVERQRRQLERAQLVQKLNPIMFKLRLGRPDRWLGVIDRWLGPFIGWPLALVWLVIVACGGCELWLSWHRFSAGITSVLTIHNGIFLAINWLLLKSIHELAHSLLCKRFGGEVSEVGILFVVLIPMPYVDVTSVWRIEDKRQRILISAAGMMAELFIAALAVMVWSRISPGVLSQSLYNLVLTASAVTILINANPLMRFDGYYILSDWLNIPNLALHGQQFVRGLAAQLCLGRQPVRIPFDRQRAAVIRLYGVAAFLWRVVVSVTLTLAAAALFSGVGLVLALISLAFWLGIPLFRIARFVCCGNEVEQPNRRRFALSVVSLVGLLIAVGTLVPGPSSLTAPALIEFDPLTVVRAESAGFVQQLHVARGQFVRVGDPIATLYNPDLEVKYSEILAELGDARLRANAYRRGEDIAAQQIAQRQIASITTQLQQIQSDQAALNIVALSSGVILAEELESALGTYLDRGDVLLAIGNVADKKATALLNQRDADAARQQIGHSVQVRLVGNWSEPLSGTLRRVAPQASTHLPDARFALAGGPGLALVMDHSQQRSSPRTDAGAATDAGATTVQPQLTEPYVVCEIDLPDDVARRTSDGQYGQLRLSNHSSSLAGYLSQRLTHWLSKHTRHNHGL